MMKFEKVVSLGSDCATRHHIDRALKIIQPSYTPETFFFDWLWRDRGFESNIIAMRDRLVLEKNDFELKQVGGSYQAYHFKTGFYFLHDFEFTNNTLNTRDLVQREFDEQYHEFNLKQQYLGQKTFDLVTSDKRLLFIFTKQDISQDQVNEFFSKVGNNSWLLHLPELNLATSMPFHDRLISKQISHQGTDWTGNHQSWDEIFFESDIFS